MYISDILWAQHGRGGCRAAIALAFVVLELIYWTARQWVRGGEGSRRSSVLSGNSTLQFQALSSWFPFKPVKQTAGEMIPGSRSSHCYILYNFRLYTLIYTLCRLEVLVFPLMLLFWYILSITNTIAANWKWCRTNEKYALFLIRVPCPWTRTQEEFGNEHGKREQKFLKILFYYFTIHTIHS